MAHEQFALRKISRRGLLAAAATTTASLAAPAIVRAQTRRLKAAVLLPRTGYLAQGGESCYRGAALAPKLLADLGFEIDLIHIDTRSDPQTARAEAERAIAEGAQCLIGAFQSAATIEVADVCQRRRTPFIVNISALPAPAGGYVFRNSPTSAALLANGLTQIKAMIATTGIEPKTAVFVHANDAFGAAQAQAMERMAPNAGLPFRIVESIAYDPRAQDLTPAVARMAALKPDIVLAVTRAADAVKLVRGMARQNVRPMALISPGAPGLYDEEFFRALGPLADYCVDVTPWADPKAPMTQALERAFKVAQPGLRFAVECFNVGFTFEALLIAADAFRRAGGGGGDELVRAIKATDLADHVMIGPPIRFDADGQNASIPSACIQNRGGTPVIVLPDGVAAIAPVLPAPRQGRRL